jgi:hypothetical protein
MQYMLMFNEPIEEFAKREDPSHAGAYWGAWNAYCAEASKAGIMVGGNGLQVPDTASTVRLRDGKRQIQDGPFAASKEHLGGYFVIEVDSLEAALEWAARSPNAGCGSTEVRPVLPPPPAQ